MGGVTMSRIDYIEEVEKFNPYHDSQGKFTTGSGGGAGATAGGAAGSATGSELHQGNQSNVDVTSNISYGIRKQDRKLVEDTLKDIRVNDTVTLSAKTFKGNDYKLSVTANDDGNTYTVNSLIKGKKTPTQIMNSKDAADEIVYFKTMAGGTDRIKVEITRNDPR
jgi:hypothetical protein